MDSEEEYVLDAFADGSRDEARAQLAKGTLFPLLLFFLLFFFASLNNCSPCAFIWLT